jgi:hypothetical protein
MGTPSPWAGIITGINAANGITGLPTGAQPTALWFSADYALVWNPNASSNGIAGQIEVRSAGTPQTLPGQTLPYGPTRYTQQTTSATPVTVATLAIPAAGTLMLSVVAIANLGTGPNANAGPTLYRFTSGGFRKGSGAPTVGLDNQKSNVSPPFVQPGVAGPGGINVIASGNNLLVQVAGFAIKEAWTSGHTYTTGDNLTVPGDFVTANGGVWMCDGGGIASGSAPSGTGTGQGTGATFTYVGPASGSQVVVNWTVVVDGVVVG